MLSGQYDILVNNMWLSEIIAVVLLLIPLFLIFFDKKWIFFFYTISIVANLPLVFSMVFNFSYEAIIGFVIVIVIISDIVKAKEFRYQTTKENLVLLLMVLIILGINLFTAFFNFNKDEFITRFFIYTINLFILFVFTYFFDNSSKIKFIKNGFIIGAIILVIGEIIEMIYGSFYLGFRDLRPAGLLLDPNVCAFALNLALALSFMERKTDVFYSDFLMVLSRVIIIFGIFLTVSRSAYIGTIFILVMITIYYSKGKKRWVVPSVVIVFIITYLIFNNIIHNFIERIYYIIDLDRIFPKSINTPPSNNNPPITGVDIGDYSNSRIDLIKAALTVFSNNFITGVGIGNVVSEINIITNMKMNAHNLVLQLLAESGILMLFTLLFFVYYLIIFFIKIEKKYKFFILLIFGLIFVESMFNHNILNLNIIFLVLAIIFGLVMLSSKERKVFIIGRDSFKFKMKKYK